MTNKCPERGEYMDQIMSQVFNPLFKTDLEKHRSQQKQLTQEIFENV